MWFWQRKEVWMGNSMQEFSRVQELLSQSGIRYDFKVRDRLKFSFGFDRRLSGMARMGENPAYLNMYYLYVHKEDFERASRLLFRKMSG